MNIVVLVKQVSDTEGERGLDPNTGLQDRSDSEQIIDEIDTRSLEIALQAKSAYKGRVTVLTMGPASAKDSLRKALAMGADEAVHVTDESLAGANALQTAQVLAAAIKELPHDLVIMGSASTDGSTGTVPAMLSELLQIPQLGRASSVEFLEQSVKVEHATETGSEVLQASFPALISVTEQVADPRYPNLRGLLTAKRKPLAAKSVADLGSPQQAPSNAKFIGLTERPPRSAGVSVDYDDTAVEQLITYLAGERIV